MNEAISLNIELTSCGFLGSKALKNSIHLFEIYLELHKPDLFEVLSPSQIKIDTVLNEGDAISEQFLLKPKRISPDTGNFADLVIRWEREKHFSQECRFPISPVCILFSPLRIEYEC